MKPSFPSQPDSRPPISYGSLQLESRYLLSPLAGYTNLPFRRIVRELGGVGLATTDLVNARGYWKEVKRLFSSFKPALKILPFAVQIFGNDLSRCATLLSY